MFSILLWFVLTTVPSPADVSFHHPQCAQLPPFQDYREFVKSSVPLLDRLNCWHGHVQFEQRPLMLLHTRVDEFLYLHRECPTCDFQNFTFRATELLQVQKQATDCRVRLQRWEDGMEEDYSGPEPGKTNDFAYVFHCLFAVTAFYLFFRWGARAHLHNP